MQFRMPIYLPLDRNKSASENNQIVAQEANAGGNSVVNESNSTKKSIPKKKKFIVKNTIAFQNHFQPIRINSFQVI